MPGPKKAALPVATEAKEQVALARWLSLRPKIVWTHCPNGEARNVVTARRLKAYGVQRGVPDILIFTPPPKLSGHAGVAVELKRRKGGRASPEQVVFMAALESCGWRCFVAHGAMDAIAKLSALGY